MVDDVVDDVVEAWDVEEATAGGGDAAVHTADHAADATMSRYIQQAVGLEDASDEEEFIKSAHLVVPSN